MIKPVTIREVAKACSVSRMTVSRVLHNDKNIKNETRRKVLDAIDRMEYNPTLNIPYIRKVRSDTKTILMTGPVGGIVEDSFFTNKAIMLFDTVVKSRNFQPRLMLDFEFFGKIRAGFHTWQKELDVDGVIMFCPNHEWNGATEQLVKWGVPVVMIRRSTDVSGVPTVTDNDYKGARLALEHLYSLGHRSIGLAGRNMTGIIPDRHDAYVGFMKEKELPFNSDHVYEIPASDNPFAGWLPDQVKGSNPMTALFCLGDDYAAAAIRGATENGLSVPGDLAVAGYDNSIISKIYNPPITTVDIPLKNLIETAGAVLFEMMEGRELTNREYTFKNELVVRKSCGGEIGVDSLT